MAHPVPTKSFLQLSPEALKFTHLPCPTLSAGILLDDKLKVA